MSKQLAILATSILLATSASAEVTVGGFPACTSKAHYLEMMSALLSDDTHALDYLERQGVCVMMETGIPVTILERGWNWTKARLYGGKGGTIVVVVWAPIEGFAESAKEPTP
jgi:hypothetical protein